MMFLILFERFQLRLPLSDIMLGFLFFIRLFNINEGEEGKAVDAKEQTAVEVTNQPRTIIISTFPPLIDRLDFSCLNN